ncbi:hypothetical protein ACOSQ4_027156 [Xanthoceras sorbifolium]
MAPAKDGFDGSVTPEFTDGVRFVRKSTNSCKSDVKYEVLSRLLLRTRLYNVEQTLKIDLPAHSESFSNNGVT